MNKIQQLISELCPDGVEYKTLGEICNVTKGKQLNRENLLKEGLIPVINGGISPSGYINEGFNFDKNHITISQGGASAGYIQWMDVPFFAGAHCFVLTNVSIYDRYLYYFLKSKQEYIMNLKYGSGIPALDKKTVLNIEVAVPLIKVQEEIVKILDSFSELNLRSNQYVYYRDKLLSFEQDKELKVKKLGEIFSVDNVGIEKKIIHGERYVKIINYMDVFENKTLKKSDLRMMVTATKSEISKCNVLKNDVFITPASEIRNEICVASTVLEDMSNVLYSDDIMRLRPFEPDYFVSKFVTYYFDSPQARKEIEKHANGSQWFWIKKSFLENFEIKVPSSKIVKKIVSFLDNFEEICSDLNIELPKEIELRNKQYEYYKDQIFNYLNTGQVDGTVERDLIRLFVYIFNQIQVT
ncbi:restriction endonuclease subunit S [Mycoplasma tullyi]|uniref:Restriction endonuclease subunit S n=1 Tax=Mycoplasma tullyi TaxID=1612150 RepID=A0A7D7U5J6_9MOLU|nr:restriction endonuclease subunit S [Mycoplasma tullyi]QMT98810.1 restriction endonuclease subunit S [Mycoplasma tullyi]